MTLIDTAFTSTPYSPTSPGVPNFENLVISIRHTSKRVTVPARPTQSWLDSHTTLETVNIWDNETDGYIYSDTINNIFTEFFKKPVKLVYKGPTPRLLRGNGAPNVLGREESTNFPDVLPVLVANEASLTELNDRLKGKGCDEITIERFRPNIIVRGASSSLSSKNSLPPAWSEDSWKSVRILPAGEPKTGITLLLGGGEKPLEIDVQARCARCQVPNVDPETAEKNKKEPWDTLVSYRRVDEGIKWKPCFGMLGCPRNEGVVGVGMMFEVTACTEEHKYIKGF